jgi:RNA-directed DNA polymerase
VKDKQGEQTPARVSRKTKQVGEIRSRWGWVEPSVWTDRMLTALEEGVKGEVWFSLIDKVYREQNLQSAFRKVKANKGSAGVDHQTIKMFEKDLEGNIAKLHKELKEQSYQPLAIKRVEIPKPGSKEIRPLGIPTVRDRVVQTALRHVIEPIYEKGFAEHSYGFRPGRGCKDALRRVEELLKSGHTYVVDVDLKSYFDTIDHVKLMGEVEKRIADGRILTMIEKYLKQAVMEGLRTWTPERGSPQGAIISPLLSNIYLSPLDHLMQEQGYEMIRYADDLVIMCQSEQEARQAMEKVREWTEQVGLMLHPQKTLIVDATRKGGFDFLGYHFERGYKWPRKKSMKKIKDTIRAKTKRCNGHSLDDIIKNVNQSTKGWFEYFKHSHKYTFSGLDGWIRMRLRSILRKRHGGKGRGRGRDHNRWPNKFFTEHGLFSLTIARELACQSAWR